MAEDNRSAPREFQLETRHLAGIALVIAILCISSFMLGRWVERQAIRARGLAPSTGAVPERLDPEDVNRELTYFRTLEGDAPSPSVPAPAPESRPAPVRVEAAPARAPSTSAAALEEETADPGGFFVQVMATKDASAAGGMRARLTKRGYRVSVVEGTGPDDLGWRKVRVGPYAARADAERAAKRLEAEEHVRTWIP